MPKSLAGRVVAYLSVLTLLAFWLVIAGPRNFAATMPDDVHTYGVRFRNGADLFFRPPIGWFFEHGLWVGLPLLGLAYVVDLIVRRTHPGAEGNDY
jgi:hypothetical protein